MVPITVGVARLPRDQRQAELVHPVDQFFPQPPPYADGGIPWHPAYAAAPLIETTKGGSFLYLYACEANPYAPDETPPGPLVPTCRVARAPVGMATAGDSWRYWDGKDWNVDQLRAVPVIRGGGVASMSHNRYLRAFLGVRSGPSNNVVLIWAQRPEGPWHPLADFPTLPGVGDVSVPLDMSLYAIEHLALRDACEQDIYLTYGRQIQVSDGAGGTERQSEMRLLKVSFK